MSRSRRKKSSAAADGPSTSPPSATAAASSSTNASRNGTPTGSGTATDPSSFNRGAPASAPAPTAPPPHSGSLTNEPEGGSTAGPRRRRRGGGGSVAGSAPESGGDAVRVAVAAAAAPQPSRTGHQGTAPGAAASRTKTLPSGKHAPSRSHAGPGAASAAAGGGVARVVGRRRRRLWRIIQWPLAVVVVVLAYAAIPRKFIEDAPTTVSELLHDSLLARLNVSLPLPPLSLPPLPKPYLDALLASTGFNVSSLIGLTDALTDTLNDLTDSLSTARLTVAVRGLLSQLPAFGTPGPLGTGGGGGGGTAANDTSGLRPGLLMARMGYRPKHPVIIVPGFITSGLELWQGLPCGQRYFRQRMWGTLAMVQAFLTDAACWFRHMELDPVTGLDPAGIKLRAAVGLEAVDYFIQGYWVWGKMVEALADIGYDSNSLVSMPYDWRLAMPLLEERDGYFTRLRMAIEALADVNGERVVITSHSYGENVIRAFMSWVEADQPGWVDEHVHAVVNIAGTTLGVPKSISALLSGETRDTAQLGALAGFLTSNMVPRATRTRVWRTWGSSYAMLPVGGPRVWGNTSWAPDDTPEMRAERRTYGAMVSLWPHDWEVVMAAAATAAPQQREELRRLVHTVSEASDTQQQQEAATATASEAEAAAVVAAAADDAVVAAATPGGETANEAAAAAASNAECGIVDGNSSSSSSNINNGDRDISGGNAGGSANGINCSRSHTGGSGSSSSSSSSSSSTMARLTDTLKRLVSSGGSDIDPKNYLDSEHITRLDVSGFLSLLRAVGGPVLEHHMREWVAVDVEEAEEEEGAAGDAARRRATAAADSKGGDGSAQARQSVGGARRLRRSVRHRAALFPDATKTPLPNAPSTAVVCLYGVGIPTERGYHYLRPPPAHQPQSQPGATSAAAVGAAETGAAPAPDTAATESPGQGEDAAGGYKPPADGSSAATAAAAAERGAATAAAGADNGSAPLPPPHNASASGEESSPEAGPGAGAGWMILKDVSDPGSALDVGVQLTDGDGTVPLLSLGLMCRSGWRPGGRLNPAGMRVVTREFKHKSVSMLQDARGGPATAAHIDILGNEAVLQDVIRVAAGRLDELDDIIHSDIDRIAAAVEL